MIDNELLAEYKKAIHWACRKFGAEFIDTDWYDDLRQAGAIGLIRAKRKCATDRPFKPYAMTAIAWAVKTEAIKLRRKGLCDTNSCQLQQFSVLDESNPGSNFGEEIACHRVEKSQVEFFELLSHLKDREREILYGKYFIGLDGVEIAKSQGVSKQMINVVEHRALGKLRKILSKEFFAYSIPQCFFVEE